MRWWDAFLQSIPCTIVPTQTLCQVKAQTQALCQARGNTFCYFLRLVNAISCCFLWTLVILTLATQCVLNSMCQIFPCYFALILCWIQMLSWAVLCLHTSAKLAGKIGSSCSVCCVDHLKCCFLSTLQFALIVLQGLHFFIARFM